MPCCRCLRLTPTTTTTASSSTAASGTDGVHGGAADLVILCPWLPHVGGFAVLMVVVAMDRRSLHAAVSRRPWHFHLQSAVESDDAATAAASSGKLMGRVHCRCFRLARRVLVSVCWGVDVLCRGSQRPQGVHFLQYFPTRAVGCRLSYYYRCGTTRKVLLVVKFYAKSSIKIQKLIENLIIENFQIICIFLHVFER